MTALILDGYLDFEGEVGDVAVIVRGCQPLVHLRSELALNKERTFFLYSGPRGSGYGLDRKLEGRGAGGHERIVRHRRLRVLFSVFFFGIRVKRLGYRVVRNHGKYPSIVQ